MSSLPLPSGALPALTQPLPAEPVADHSPFTADADRIEPQIELLEEQGATLPLAALAHALPSLLFAVSADRRHAFVNHHWLHYTGVGTAQALARRWTEVVHPQDHATVRDAASSVARGGHLEAIEAELRLRDATGAYRWHRLRARLLPEGDRTFWVGAVEDIEAQKHAEAVLARREREYRTVIDHALDGICRLDRELRHVYANDSMLATLDVSAQRLLGHTAQEAGLPETVATALQEAASNALQQNREQTFEFDLPAADGGLHHYLCRMIPQLADEPVAAADAAAQPREHDGRDTGAGAGSVLCIASDVTHRRRALLALQDSEQRFRQFAQSSDDVFWFADLTRDELLYVSPAFDRLWGFAAESLATAPSQWTDAVLPEDRDRLPTPFFASQADANGHEPVREYRVRRPDGSLRWVRDRRFPLQVSLGQVLRIGGIAEDITERKLRDLEREELLARERAARGDAEALASAKDEFLAVVSHELRSPLNAIRGWAHVLRKTADLPADRLRPLDAIDRNVAAQARMVDDLLDTQRLLRGKVKLEIHRTPLAALLEQAAEAFRPQADDKGIRLTVHHAPDVPLIDVDGERLRQSLVNLLSNALKFTPAGGQVSVRSARLSKDRVAIDVVDTGVGLEPDQAERVFEPFRQAGGTYSTRRQGGLGLGLALARQLVELHGGRLLARSDGPDRGSTFTIELPAPPPEESPALTASATDLAPAPALAGRRVMVLEDDPEGRQILELLLRDERVDATFFSNAQDGFAHLRRLEGSQRPEVILSDIAMPGEDGYSFIARVRNLHRERGEPPIPAVALTAFASPTDRRRALAAGFDAHLPKPLDPEQLRAALKDLLRAPTAPDSATAA